MLHLHRDSDSLLLFPAESGHWSRGIKKLVFVFFFFEAVIRGDFPYGPVLRTSPSSAEGAGSIPGRGSKIPHALQSENRGVKQKQYCNKFKKDFKNGPHQKNF